MNEYQKALSRMYENLDYASYYYLDDKCDDDYDLLFELIDKATPKKVDDEMDYTPICPNCKEYIDVDVEYYAKIRTREGKDNYCPYCGQKLVYRGKEDVD